MVASATALRRKWQGLGLARGSPAVLGKQGGSKHLGMNEDGEEEEATRWRIIATARWIMAVAQLIVAVMGGMAAMVA